MFTLNCKGRLLVIDEPIIMGILNTTPDSFYSGSRVSEVQDIVSRAERMINEGAMILDIGGQSTRPGSEDVGAEEEMKRVLPAIEAIAKNFPEVYISIDTYHSAVASEAVAAGASIVNDVSGGSLDAAMIPTVGRLGVPYVCMHIKGNPGNMQELAQYDNLAREVLDYFIAKLDECRNAGINDLVIDPGFGFAKTIAHNFSLLKQMEVLKMLERPVLAGLSRKSTVYKTLGLGPEDALNGTTVLNTIALLNGADILRVHDVREAREAIRLVSAYRSA